VQFIEDNIRDNLSAELISRHVGYSVHHFSRIFFACYGMTVMEYVRRRRLSLGIHALSQGMKVLDVALLYGFETASGFSKAFRRHYNCSPTEYIDNMKLKQPNEKELGVDDESLIKNMKIVKREAFFVAGYVAAIENVTASSTGNVAALWGEVDMSGLETLLYEKLNPYIHGEIGIFLPGENGEARYVLGVIVNDFDKVEADMECLEVPEAIYAVFTTLPVDESANPGWLAKIIKRTWKSIFEKWFENSGYEYDAEKLDFEYYDERCHPKTDALIEIWVPVKKDDT
jgi:AraC family transcriptional regulator